MWVCKKNLIQEGLCKSALLSYFTVPLKCDHDGTRHLFSETPPSPLGNILSLYQIKPSYSLNSNRLLLLGSVLSLSSNTKKILIYVKMFFFFSALFNYVFILNGKVLKTCKTHFGLLTAFVLL